MKTLLASPLVRQFLKFGLAGIAGLSVDTVALYALLYGVGTDFYSGRAVSFLMAVTTTWALNRAFTFKGDHPGPMWRQWLAFLGANSFGAVVNYATYAALVTWSLLAAAYPIIAVAAGSIAGMFFNFAASKKLVFRGA
ncbi:MAG TPA: GtrA family protein [Azospirillaceae bacterium]|nr:GtrA family protein [Azospirillaceae bacterium]